MNYIKLTLSGVLQYYADNNSIALRTTYNSSIAPTKSAVIGLIASALGLPRKSEQLTSLYNALTAKYKIISSGQLFEDFQTIKPLKSQSHYMNKFYSRNQFNTVGGGVRDGQLIKNIQYLQDSEFEVYIGSNNDDLLRKIFEAIKNPEYALYFGKRSCVPNKPIVTTFEMFDEEELNDVHDCA